MSFFSLDVLSFEPHCISKEPALNLTDSCTKYNLVPNISCAEAPLASCLKDANGECFLREGNEGNSRWYDNSYFMNSVSEKNVYEKFLMDYYGVTFPNENLSSYQINTIQQTINNVVYSVQKLPDVNILAGDCPLVCEDSKLGNGTLSSFDKCVLACPDPEKKPSYDQSKDSFFCFENVKIDSENSKNILDSNGCCQCPDPEKQAQVENDKLFCGEGDAKKEVFVGNGLDDQMCCLPEASCEIDPAELISVDNTEACCVPVTEDFEEVNNYCFGLEFEDLSFFDKSFFEKKCSICKPKWEGNSLIRPESSSCDSVLGTEELPFCGEYPSCDVDPMKLISNSDPDNCCLPRAKNNIKMCENLKDKDFATLVKSDFESNCSMCKVGPEGRLTECIDEDLKEDVPFCGDFPAQNLTCEVPLEAINPGGQITDYVLDCCVSRDLRDLNNGKKEDLRLCNGFESITESDLSTFDFSKKCLLYALDSSYSRPVSIVDPQNSSLTIPNSVEEYNFCPKDCGSVAIGDGENPEGCCVEFESVNNCVNKSDFDGMDGAEGPLNLCKMNDGSEYSICPFDRELSELSPCGGIITSEMLSDCTCGMKLNTIVPFIGDCIQFGGNIEAGARSKNTTVVGPNTAFPVLMAGLSKIVVTLILIFSFLLVITAGVMMTTGGLSEGNFSKGKQLLMKVIAGLALLGASGIILKLVNPSFFG